MVCHKVDMDGGGSNDDSYSYGGGWAQGSNSGQTKSWSLDTNAVGTDGARSGNGQVTITLVE